MIIFSDSYFDGHLADSPELRARARRLRYQVYCVEHAYEPREQPVAGEERDPYDARAVAFLFTHRESGLDVGTVRLVFAADSEGLPFRHAMAGHPLLPLDSGGPTAEVSRLAISKTFRRRVEDGDAPWNMPGERPDVRARPFHPGSVFGLMRCILTYSRFAKLACWYAMMEPSLARRLARTGVVAEPLGPVIQHHGLRAPYRFPLAAAEAQLRANEPVLWAYVTGRDGGTRWDPATVELPAQVGSGTEGAGPPV